MSDEALIELSRIQRAQGLFLSSREQEQLRIIKAIIKETCDEQQRDDFRCHSERP